MSLKYRYHFFNKIFFNNFSKVAQEEKRKDLEREKLLLEKNDARNQEILGIQLVDINENIKKGKLDVEKRLLAKQSKEEMFIMVAEEKIKALKEKVKSFIDPNNLEFEIEKMLNERHDHNFSINANGSLFRNSVKVTRKQAFDSLFTQEPKTESLSSSSS